MIINLPAEEVLPLLKDWKPTLIFADPPDNLGLKYGEYDDNIPLPQYYLWLEKLLRWSLKIAPVVWFSYYWRHDLEIKHVLRNLLKFEFPSFQAHTVLWRYTFGQHRKSDLGSGFRYMLYLRRSNSTVYPDNIRITSARQRIGDARANPDGRVPDDVWDFPRVTGNSHERRPWHPTQHPEALMSRVLKLTTKENDKVLDLFGGTFTCHRTGLALNRICVSCEIDTEYCLKGAEEMDCEILHTPEEVKCALLR